jgi:hypothetical protein
VEEGVHCIIQNYVIKTKDDRGKLKDVTQITNQQKAFRLLLSEEECHFIEYLVAEKYIP